MSQGTVSTNWAKLKDTLPQKPAATQRYLKKRKRMNSASSGQSSKPDPALLDVLSTPEASTSAAAHDAGKYIAMDCEFVGVGPKGSASSLARVSIVNFHGHVLLDTFVRQKEQVTDYRTWVSGVRAKDLRGAPSFEDVCRQVADLCKGRVLVGHAIWNDLQVLLLSHPHAQTRDTALYKPLQELSKSKRPSLRNLAKLVLNLDIQGGEHSSVEDARATMAIFRAHREAWDASLQPGAKPKKAAPIVPKSAIDPTRRFRHARSLNLAQAAEEAGLLPRLDDDEVDPQGGDVTATSLLLNTAPPAPAVALTEPRTSSPPKAKRKKVVIDRRPTSSEGPTVSSKAPKTDWWLE